MTLLLLPKSNRGYLLGALAGLITTIGVTAAGRLLVHLGLHADLTYLDDGLLGVLVALLVLVLHRYHHIERLEHQERLSALIALHQGIAADLQAIASITGNSALAAIAGDAAIRVNAVLAQLPHIKEGLERMDERAKQAAPRLIL